MAGPPKVPPLLRRKSCLPQDYETTLALKAYKTVESELPSSKED